MPDPRTLRGLDVCDVLGGELAEDGGLAAVVEAEQQDAHLAVLAAAPAAQHVQEALRSVA